MEFISKDNNKITFKNNSRTFTRTLNKDNEFSFNNEKYFFHYSFSMGYGDSYKIHKITSDLKERLSKYEMMGWRGVDNFINDLSSEFSHKQGNVSEIPSAPNSSIFRATVSGFIKPQDRPSTVGRSQYSCGTYFHKALQVGGNAKTEEEMIAALRYVLPRLAKPLGYNDSDSKVTYRESMGTNFCTYGIG